MNRKRPDPITKRVYGIRYFYLVISQLPQGMVVRSRHLHRETALQAGEKLNRRSETTNAVVSLIGNPTQEYLVGDVLNPTDVNWKQPPNPDRCSMCCHPYCSPVESLDKKCGILRGNPPCLQVQSLIVKRETT